MADHPKRWLTVGLESGISFPTEEMTVKFSGREFLLRPETDKHSPTVAMAFEPPMDDTQALSLIRRFLSALAWVERGFLRETATFGTGGRPGRIGKGPGARMINPGFRLDCLPTVENERQKLCLALYREALNLNSVPLQFLGFFKVINVLHKSGSKQQAWINSAIPTINDHRAIERIKELQRNRSDLGKYLYESGRCAIAHAFAHPVVDPDDPSETRRLKWDLPVIQALAEIVIERELGIKSKTTFRREHLYQLEGFRLLFGPTPIQNLKAGLTVQLSALPAVPSLGLRVRGYEKYPALDSMGAEVISINKGCVWLRLGTEGEAVVVLLGLDFQAECIDFDLRRGIATRDDGSDQAIRNALDHNRFFRDLVTNGELEIWDCDNGKLMGRADPLLPVNVRIGETVKSLGERRKQLEAMLLDRTKRDNKKD